MMENYLFFDGHYSAKECKDIISFETYDEPSDYSNNVRHTYIKKGIVWFDDCSIPYQSDDDKESARFGTQTDIRGNAYGTNRPSEGHILNKNVFKLVKRKISC